MRHRATRNYLEAWDGTEAHRRGLMHQINTIKYPRYVGGAF